MTYIAPVLSDWQGRIDSEEDFDAFRWHQWINPLDLTLNIYQDPQVPKGACNFQSSPLRIGFIGFAVDEGIRLNKGRPGAALGPKMIRKELSNLPCLFTKQVLLYDCGDIVSSMIDQQHQSSIDMLSGYQQELSICLEKMLQLGLFPIVLGGGHELALGHYLGLSKGYENLSIVNLDAHLDMRPYKGNAHCYPSSGTMFRQIADMCLEQKQRFHYLCLGLQRRGNTVALLKSAIKYGTTYRYARSIIDEPLINSLSIINQFASETNHIYLTLCSDVIASAYAPGVSAAQPLGLHPETVLDLIKAVLHTRKVVAFDVAEVSPRFDQDNTTANLACTYIFAVVNTLSELVGQGIDL